MIVWQMIRSFIYSCTKKIIKRNYASQDDGVRKYVFILPVISYSISNINSIQV